MTSQRDRSERSARERGGAACLTLLDQCDQPEGPLRKVSTGEGLHRAAQEGQRDNLYEIYSDTSVIAVFYIIMLRFLIYPYWLVDISYILGNV